MDSSIEMPVWPQYDHREKELLLDVLESRKWWRMNGNKVDTFEKKFAEFCNAEYCIALTNGTHALELSLATLGIGKGDEVIVPAITFISTATAPIYNCATPVPVDCDPKTFCIIPEAIEKAITPKTKAIIPVHMAGQPCDMDRICEIAKKYNLRIIEDAAHAHGAEWKNKKIGTFGEFAIFSFQNGKIMTCGEGGAILTNSKELYDKAFLIHSVGRPKFDKVYKHLELGSNYRMSEFPAAILLAQLERLPEQNKLREKNAKILDNLLKPVEGITPQSTDERVTINTHYMYMFYYDELMFNGITREEFVQLLNDNGIPSYICFPIVSNTDFFKEGKFRSYLSKIDITNIQALPNAERMAKEVIWLPHYLLLGNEAFIKHIASVILKIKEKVLVSML
ncbi:MAG: glutamine--scyllo-inositol aminotransferase [Bacteroidetes bacterium GWC2_33_15]|nr:MAG: glutamine--scyllo-inositol aminotransferase [Bacteroidetes bacterium GWA2_33_15]OFX51826.1 MAG: glutamine--scyllo-inositol aminotransferase [Bacteroidetes bacterium GWC2_33_15]OFX66878.1 MAG: glutamine--scyllo-inositol aminotransferase [Bacteroidetes bacterium GWB2_32_14]OFX67120.1 MAG: glutamine--scyllo-inositol aminotransferase [Bacteroidetes bacterium GWD2_33_33]HAN17200.1 DegT/DnrJ/EryC1/StrS family aminotransferase [Bacteroidales bacterium]